jgi:exonuclease SbcD
MPITFLHFSDVHLGYQQYGDHERFNDFGRAFLKAVDFAVAKQVDFVLISGDLFHKSAIDPPTLLQAANGLEGLRNAGISAVAIAGNHDRAKYRDRYSWLDYLAERGYITLLSPSFEEAGIVLKPWDGHTGAYVDFGPVRVIGVPYLGSSIKTVVAELPAALDAIRDENVHFTILMMHAGLEGEMLHVTGELTQTELGSLREHIDYLALGHFHKPFERQDWIFNPGSLETCGMDERRWKGGSYYVTVDVNNDPMLTFERIKSARRPFHRLSIKVDEYKEPASLYDGIRASLENGVIQWTGEDQKPVVEINLEGILGFDRGDLDLIFIEDLVKERISPLLVRVKNNTRPVEFEISTSEHYTRPQLERGVLQDIIRRDSRFRGAAVQLADLMVQVKEMALIGSAPEAIVGTVREGISGLKVTTGLENSTMLNNSTGAEEG